MASLHNYSWWADALKEKTGSITLIGHAHAVCCHGYVIVKITFVTS